jgi:glucans biosynthesis protein
LLVETAAGEWLWRPLNNPAALSTVAFVEENPRGFGLLQRDRTFEHYLDAEAHYHQRPGLWVTPLGDWGKGRIELVEIPTDSETNDNIVAYWVPQKPVQAGQVLRFNYRLQTVNRDPAHAGRARVEATRNGWGYTPGGEQPPRTLRQFIVDFSAADLQGLAQQQLQADLSVMAGEYRDLAVKYLEDSGQWRVAFKVKPDEDKTVDMRLFLTLHGRPVSEVWNYVWNRNELEQ